MKICPQCKCINKDDAQVCKKCHTQLQTATVNMQEMTTKTFSNQHVYSQTHVVTAQTKTQPTKLATQSTPSAKSHTTFQSMGTGGIILGVFLTVILVAFLVFIICTIFEYGWTATFLPALYLPTKWIFRMWNIDV